MDSISLDWHSPPRMCDGVLVCNYDFSNIHAACNNCVILVGLLVILLTVSLGDLGSAHR